MMQSCTTNVPIVDAAVVVTWNRFTAMDDESWINSELSLLY